MHEVRLHISKHLIDMTSGDWSFDGHNTLTDMQYI